jgi:DNA modification methylase
MAKVKGTGTRDNPYTGRSTGQNRRELFSDRKLAVDQSSVDLSRLQIEYLPIDVLKANPSNPRIHTDKQIMQLAASIQKFGLTSPFVLGRDQILIAGHCRWLAARRLGLKMVPVIRLEHLTELQARALMIADNKLASNATWDEKLLGEQLKILSEAEINFDLEILGFEMGQIDVLIEGLDSATNEGLKDDDGTPRNKPAVTRPGDLWALAANHLYCGNSLERSSYSTLMEKKRAAMVVTDPPFNVPIDGNVSGLGTNRHREFAMASGEMSEAEFTDFLAQVITLLVMFSVSGSLHFIFMDWRHIRELLTASKHVYSEYKSLCVWVKDNGGMGSLYRSQHELCAVLKNGSEPHSNNVQLGRFGRNRTNVWRYPGANSFSRNTEEGDLLKLHPTVKPVALVADTIMDCSKRGQIILDPFLGSGTTLIAAEKTGRICYGIEIDPLYVDVAVRRWQKFTGLEAKHAISGKSFTEIEQEVNSGSE